MDVAHCFGAQSLGLLLCFDSLYPPFCQQFLVELLQMQRRQIIQRDLAELRLDVVFDVAMIGQVGGWAHFDFGIVLIPHFSPVTHGVGLGPSVVDAHIFLDGFLQLFLDFRLRLSKDVFNDGLSCFWIVTDCVPTLPASVLSFADISLPVCSSLWHMLSNQRLQAGILSTKEPDLEYMFHRHPQSNKSGI